MTKKNNKKTIDRDVFVKSGKKGGLSTAKRGENFYKEIGALGAMSRWGEKKEEEVVSPEEIPSSNN